MFYFTKMKCIFVLLVLTSFVRLGDCQNKQIIYKRCDIDTWITNLTIDNTTEQILDFRPEDNRLYPKWVPSRVSVQSDSINKTLPLFVTVNQQPATYSWQLPMTEDDDTTYSYFSRTLCPSGSESQSNWPLIHLSTENTITLNVSILVKLIDNFELKLANASKSETGWSNITVRSNEPKYFSFRFPHQPNATGVQNVILTIESDRAACALVSVQDLACPVYNDEEDVRHRGDFLTMLDKGGLTISQSNHPIGFYVVLMARSSDKECVGETTALSRPRDKTFRLRVVPTISYEEYAIAGVAVLTLLAVYLCVFSMVAYWSGQWERASVRSELPENNEETDEQNEINVEHEATLLPARPTLATLCRLQDSALQSRSDKYLWSVLLVTVFYSLPVLQLVVTYQNMLQRTGNQDLCYYNYLCAHPLGMVSDLNHVYSNAGYLVLGAALLVIVRRRQKKGPVAEDMGIPQHYGMLYAMAFSCIAEGVLSAAYHLCPNKMNFQFDSSFMYVICTLCMVKLYQGRHPDVNARAHTTFGVLAVFIFIGFSEVLFSEASVASYTAYWAGLVCTKTLFGLWLSCKMYYLSDWDISYCVKGTVELYRLCRARRPPRMRVRSPQRFAMLAVANAVNWAFDIYGLIGAMHRTRDIPVHILQVMVLNTMLYIAMYIITKYRHGERLTRGALVGLLSSLALWTVSVYFFINGTTKWAWTPAQSRGRNAPCLALRAFDSHDLWHLSSAPALFHTVCLLLVIDDDLVRTRREDIAL